MAADGPNDFCHGLLGQRRPADLGGTPQDNRGDTKPLSVRDTCTGR